MKLTGGLLAGLVVAILLIDGVLIYTGHPSFSRMLLNIGGQWPIATLLLGVLVGHLWWPQRPPCPACDCSECEAKRFKWVK